MNPMSIRDSLNSSSRESFSTSEPLTVVGVCLDEETWTVLKLFAESAPLIKLRSHISEYSIAGRQWTIVFIEYFAAGEGM